MDNIQHQLQQLNPVQLRATTNLKRHMVVLAGAGSGKTRVLVYRIAWLLAEQGASLYSIFAVTFTNKAAGEMRSRLEQMLDMPVQGVWVGTFHGLAHKLLRQHAETAGLPKAFQVIDSEDQLRLIKRIFKALDINEERWDPKKVQHFINQKKDEGIRADKINTQHNIYEKVMVEVFIEYEKRCFENGLVDFAELLLRAYELLKENPTLLSRYQARFQHFLVDEFQDTNTIQYLWLKLLSQQATTVTIVGDDDQSIYGWRGAKVENIQRFEQEFKETEIIRLEQNYRSTHVILNAANALINFNDNRMGKTLWTEGEQGDPITLYAALSEEDEALFVVRKVKQYIKAGGHYQDIGILYRSNAQSRVLEEAFVRTNVPYRIYGGVRFFERAEIKDALAYLRLSVNVNDNTAFERVINTPPRGIGEKTLQKVRQLAEQNHLTLWHAAKKAVADKMVTGKAYTGFVEFITLIEEIAESITHQSLAAVIEQVIQKSFLLTFFRTQRGEKAQSRAENLEELVNASNDFSADVMEVETASHETMLLDFLAYASLDAGEHLNKNHEDSVQLMTLHSAKGLEFPMVFLCGLEEGLFPHQFSIDSPSRLEEERRLCYVGITRAMQHLYITYAKTRRLFGREEFRVASRFIHEIPKTLIRDEGRKISVKKSFNYEPYKMAPDFDFDQDLPPYQLGQRVSHPKFGVGTVVGFEGCGEKSRINIQFDKVGSKWLILSYAKLEYV